MFRQMRKRGLFYICNGGEEFVLGRREGGMQGRKGLSNYEDRLFNIWEAGGELL